MCKTWTHSRLFPGSAVLIRNLKVPGLIPIGIVGILWWQQQQHHSRFWWYCVSHDHLKYNNWTQWIPLRRVKVWKRYNAYWQLDERRHSGQSVASSAVRYSQLVNMFFSVYANQPLFEFDLFWPCIPITHTNLSFNNPTLNYHPAWYFRFPGTHAIQFLNVNQLPELELKSFDMDECRVLNRLCSAFQKTRSLILTFIQAWGITCLCDTTVPRILQWFLLAMGLTYWSHLIHTNGRLHRKYYTHPSLAWYFLSWHFEVVDIIFFFLIHGFILKPPELSIESTTSHGPHKTGLVTKHK